ncbi:MAG: hypothetical protein ACLQGP_42670, partial [Isosphaeraceae bacterium]
KDLRCATPNMGYDQLCAYMAIYIHQVTGSPTVDHMIPRTVDWNQVYEWENYRLACSLMNSRKHDAIAVLDPFRVEPGWFELELVGFQVMAGETLPPRVRERVDRTIARLRLNERDCREAREDYAVEYWNGLPFSRLIRQAPFVAMELRRQRRLRPCDQ